MMMSNRNVVVVLLMALCALLAPAVARVLQTEGCGMEESPPCTELPYCSEGLEIIEGACMSIEEDGLEEAADSAGDGRPRFCSLDPEEMRDRPQTPIAKARRARKWHLKEAFGRESVRDFFVGYREAVCNGEFPEVDALPNGKEKRRAREEALLASLRNEFGAAAVNEVLDNLPERVQAVIDEHLN